MSTKTKVRINDHTDESISLEYEQSGSSDSETTLNPLKALEYQPPNKVGALDKTKLHLYHVNNLTYMLADAGITAEQVMTCFQILEMQQDSHTKFPKEDERLRFAETVGEMSKMKGDQLKQFIDSMTRDNSTIRAEYSSMLHHLKIRGVVFVDPVKGRAYTASEAFLRFVRSDQMLNLGYDTVLALDAIKYCLRDFSEIIKPRRNPQLHEKLQKNVFDITVLQSFLDIGIDVDPIITHSKVRTGVIKSVAPLPFIHPVAEGVSKKSVSQVVVSRAFQDILDIVPVSLAKGANCSQSIETYTFQSYDKETRGYVQKSYFMPITIAADGFNGDMETTDIFDAYFGGGDEPQILDDDLTQFAKFDPEIDVGPYLDMARPYVDTKPYDEENMDFFDEDKKLPRKDTDYSRAILGRIFGSDKIIPKNGVNFMQFSYKKTSGKDFPIVKGVKLLDLATYNFLFKEETKLAKQHVFVVLGSFSQLIMAIPVHYLNRTQLGRDLLEASKSLKTCFSNHDYLVLIHGLAKKFAPVASTTFVATTLLMHKEKTKAVTCDTIQKLVVSSLTKVPRGKISKGTIPTEKNMLALVQAMYRQEMVRNPLYPYSAAKMKGPHAYEAMTALSEGSLGYSMNDVDYEGDGDYYEGDHLSDDDYDIDHEVSVVKGRRKQLKSWLQEEPDDDHYDPDDTYEPGDAPNEDPVAPNEEVGTEHTQDPPEGESGGDQSSRPSIN